MTHVLIYRDADRFEVRVNHGLGPAEGYTFNTRDAAERFARVVAGPTGSVRSSLDMTDEEIQRLEDYNRRAYNG